MNSRKWTKSSVATTVLCVGLIAGGAFALVQSHYVRLTAKRHLAIDLEVGAATAALVGVESRQVAAAYTILSTYDQTGRQNTQRLADAKNRLDRLTEQLQRRSQEIAELAYGASEEHDDYEVFLESLSLATATKLEFCEDLRTIGRLVGEGRAAEARRFANDVQANAERTGNAMLAVLGQFQADSLRRFAEHQANAWRAAWTGLTCVIAACLTLTFSFRLRLRHACRDFARRMKEVAPRAEHLRVIRAHAQPADAHVVIGESDQPLFGCRVLAAEDGPHNQRLIKRVLTTAGAEVVIADNGDDAVELTFAAHKEDSAFDVVLMDMQMPVMDGMEATRTLRRFHYQGPIVAVSANSHGQNREQCLDAGCDDYLAKPISRDELLAVVGKFYGSTTEDAAELVSMGATDE